MGLPLSKLAVSLSTVILSVAFSSTPPDRAPLAVEDDEVVGPSPVPFIPRDPVIKVESAPPQPSPWMDIPALVTGYSPHDRIDSDHWSSRDHITSIGVDWRLYPYGVAAAPTVIPYHTYVAVPGYEPMGRFTSWKVDDTGGFPRKRWRQRGIIQLDLRFASSREAHAWGSRWMMVYVHTGCMTQAQVAVLTNYRQVNLYRVQAGQ